MVAVAVVATALSVLEAAALTITTAAISFPGVTLDGTDQPVNGSTSAWRANATGEAGGWKVTVASTDFDNGAGKTVAVANFETRLLDANVVVVSGDTNKPASTQTAFGPLSGTALMIASASGGTGDGVYDLTPDFRLTVPAETFADSYTATVTVTISAAIGSTWFLHNNPTPPTGDTTSQLNLPLDQTAPTATILYNYDANRDSFVGLFIDKGGAGATETDPVKHQAWRTSALGSSLTIDGTVTVPLWSAIKDFGLGKSGEVTVFLRDYDGSTYTEICNGTLTDADWQGGSGTWVEKAISFTCASYTIPAGNFLEVKLIVGDSSADEIWFSYDTTSYNSRVALP